MFRVVFPILKDPEFYDKILIFRFWFKLSKCVDGFGDVGLETSCVLAEKLGHGQGHFI